MVNEISRNHWLATTAGSAEGPIADDSQLSKEKEGLKEDSSGHVTFTNSELAKRVFYSLSERVPPAPSVKASSTDIIYVR